MNVNKVLNAKINDSTKIPTKFVDQQGWFDVDKRKKELSQELKLFSCK